MIGCLWVPLEIARTRKKGGRPFMPARTLVIKVLWVIRGVFPAPDPHYLIYERPGNFYLNMIDPSRPLFMPPLFTEFLRFARLHWEAGENLLIHCNRGDSRAPSLALLFLAKVVRVLPADGYWEALEKFINLYPNYLPGQGIQIYLGKNWGSF